MKGLALILGAKPKGKGAPPDEEDSADDASESDDMGDDYKAEMAEAAKAGDWDAFADAVAGYVRACK